MITDVWHFSINCVSDGPQPITVYIMVPFPPIFGVPQPNITVTMAVSALSQGFEGDRAGAIGANITHYQHVNARGEIEDVDVPADFFHDRHRSSLCGDAGADGGVCVGLGASHDLVPQLKERREPPMISQRTDRIRRQPSGAAHVFVLYDRSTGAIVGVHHLLSAGAPPSGSPLPAEKQRAAAKALDEALLRRVALTAGLPATRVASLRVRAPLGDFSQMRVDVARRRLVRVAGRSGRPRLSTLDRPRRPRTH